MNEKRLNILVTGAGGFLGAALTRFWHGQGHAVSILARPPSDFRRLRGLETELQTGRCGNAADILSFVRAARPDIIVHTACAYGRRGETVPEMIAANVAYGAALLHAAGDDFPGVFMNAGTVLDSRLGPYALSKNQFSAWGRLLAGTGPGGLRFINARLQHMYGPGDDPSKFTTGTLHALRAHMPSLPLTTGEQKRDFIHIDDAVRAWDAVMRHADRFPGYTDIDIGTGQAPPVRTFVETAHELTGSRTALDFGALPCRPHEPAECRADTAILSGLGWSPAHDLRSGLADTIAKEFPA